jgi:uncharacterized protein with GYD domain
MGALGRRWPNKTTQRIAGVDRRIPREDCSRPQISREDAMTLYMVQFAYTAEAWTAFTKHPEDRTAGVKALAEKLGCRFEALYYSFGEYDGLVVVEAPDEATVTAFVLAAISPGHLRASKTTVLMRAGAVVEAMKKAGGVSYKGPKK